MFCFMYQSLEGSGHILGLGGRSVLFTEDFVLLFFSLTCSLEKSKDPLFLAVGYDYWEGGKVEWRQDFKHENWNFCIECFHSVITGRWEGGRSSRKRCFPPVRKLKRKRREIHGQKEKSMSAWWRALASKRNLITTVDTSLAFEKGQMPENKLLG